MGAPPGGRVTRRAAPTSPLLAVGDFTGLVLDPVLGVTELAARLAAVFLLSALLLELLVAPAVAGGLLGAAARFVEVRPYPAGGWRNLRAATAGLTRRACG